MEHFFRWLAIFAVAAIGTYFSGTLVLDDLQLYGTHVVSGPKWLLFAAISATAAYAFVEMIGAKVEAGKLLTKVLFGGYWALLVWGLVAVCVGSLFPMSNLGERMIQFGWISVMLACGIWFLGGKKPKKT